MWEASLFLSFAGNTRKQCTIICRFKVDDQRNFVMDVVCLQITEHVFLVLQTNLHVFPKTFTACRGHFFFLYSRGLKRQRFYMKRLCGLDYKICSLIALRARTRSSGLRRVLIWIFNVKTGSETGERQNVIGRQLTATFRPLEREKRTKQAPVIQFLILQFNRDCTLQATENYL